MHKPNCLLQRQAQHGKITSRHLHTATMAEHHLSMLHSLDA